MPTTIVSLAFGKILREYRVRARISQEELAVSAQLNRNYIGMLERGERQPTLETILQIAEALNVSASTLVTKTISVLKE